MLKLIKELREQTGAGVIDVKKALDEASGDREKALEIIKEKGLQKADKKADRVAGEGVVVSYIHADGKSGSIVKVLCESDFVARNEAFRELANDIAMQIVAMNPKVVKESEVTPEMIEEEINELEKSLKEDGLSGDDLASKIKQETITIKKNKALYAQSFIKDPDMTVEDLIKSKIATIGENIKVDKFVKIDI